MLRQVGAHPPQNLLLEIRHLIAHQPHCQGCQVLHWLLSARVGRIAPSWVCCCNYAWNHLQQRWCSFCKYDLLRLGPLQGLSNLLSKSNWFLEGRRLGPLRLWLYLHLGLFWCQLPPRYDPCWSLRIPQVSNRPCLLPWWQFRGYYSYDKHPGG